VVNSAYIHQKTAGDRGGANPGIVWVKWGTMAATTLVSQKGKKQTGGKGGRKTGGFNFIMTFLLDDTIKTLVLCGQVTKKKTKTQFVTLLELFPAITPTKGAGKEPGKDDKWL